jgi:hypothetical protein
MTISEIEARAEKALTQALRQISYAKLKDIEYASAEAGQPRGILAHVEVLGHSYLLTCMVERDGRLAHEPARVRSFIKSAGRLVENTIPVVIASSLSPEAQADCKAANAGFLDLEGNARLSMGEVFLAERSFPRHVPQRTAVSFGREGQSHVAPFLRVRSRLEEAPMDGTSVQPQGSDFRGKASGVNVDRQATATGR